MVQHVTLTGRFSDAVAYAAIAHAGQVRKGTDVPYLSHLLAVAALVLEHGGDESQATAAILHDVVEDHGGQRRLEDVAARFGQDIADLVAALSDAAPADGEAKAHWAERKQAYLGHLRELAAAGDPAVLVSLCDKLHNATAIVADATDPGGPGPGVWARFTAEALAGRLVLPLAGGGLRHRGRPARPSSASARRGRRRPRRAGGHGGRLMSASPEGGAP